MTAQEEERSGCLNLAKLALVAVSVMTLISLLWQTTIILFSLAAALFVAVVTIWAWCRSYIHTGGENVTKRG